ncbi:MAG: hypothetical protein JWM04_2386 [Verrucomicrobiales bacterium]|jgi:hypothetical protein|nr:hypothetical protein [Verrucomicrobiales bacterium]
MKCSNSVIDYFDQLVVSSRQANESSVIRPGLVLKKVHG